MPIDVVGAAVGYLVQVFGDAGISLVRGSADERALKGAVGQAVMAVVDRADPASQEELRRGLEQCFSSPPRLRVGASSSVGDGVRAAIAEQVGWLTRWVSSDTGRPFYEGVSVAPEWVTAQVTDALITALRNFAAAGGLAQLVQGLDTAEILARLDEIGLRVADAGRRPPRLIGVIPRRAGYFVDRDVARDLDYVIDGAPRVWILSGLGGVGKTQLAAEYARRALDDPQAGLVMWVDASSRAALISGYAEAATAVIGGDGSRTDQDAVRFLAWLATSHQRWLIVLDDLSDPGDIAGLWPPDVYGGWTVVTTRRRDDAFTRAREVIDVGVYTESEALAYVNAALTDELADDVYGLALDLGLLPLALSHAVAYMIDLDLSCSDYLRRFHDRRIEIRLRHLFPGPSALPDDSNKTIAVTWSLSVDGADQLEPAGLARPLLELASVLAPQAIPSALFTTTAVCRWLNDHSGAASFRGEVGQRAVRDGLRCLRRFNLVSIADDTVRVHSLVQRATRDEIRSNDEGPSLDEVVHVAADALAEAWPDVEPDPGVGRLLRTNAEAVTGSPVDDDTLWRPAVHLVLLRAGRSLGESGQAKAALDHFERLHRTARRLRGDDHPDTLAVRHGCARWQGAAGDPVGAKAAFGVLLADAGRRLGAVHPAVLAARGNLAYWQGMAGDPQGAADAFDALLTDMGQLYPPDDPDVLATRHGHAWWHGVAGHPQHAADAFDALLTDMGRLYPPDDPDVLATRHGHAWWHGVAGHPQEAARALQQLVPDIQRVRGADHPASLTGRGNLAYWQGVAGDPAGAADALRVLLGDIHRVLGADHPSALITRGNLAHWQGVAGDAAGTATALRELLADTQRALDTENPVTLSTQEMAVSWQAGDPAGAATSLRALLTGQVPVLGPAHPSASTDHFLDQLAIAPPDDADDLIRLITTLHQWQAERPSARREAIVVITDHGDLWSYLWEELWRPRFWEWSEGARHPVAIVMADRRSVGWYSIERLSTELRERLAQSRDAGPWAAVVLIADRTILRHGWPYPWHYLDRVLRHWPEDGWEPAITAFTDSGIRQYPLDHLSRALSTEYSEDSQRTTLVITYPYRGTRPE